MIKHIVMWKFQPNTQESQEKFIRGLLDLKDMIPQIRELEVGRNVAPGNYDAVMVSAFDSMEDLLVYKNDPRHVEIANLCAAIRVDRVAVDYEV